MQMWLLVEPALASHSADHPPTKRARGEGDARAWLKRRLKRGDAAGEIRVSRSHRSECLGKSRDWLVRVALVHYHPISVARFLGTARQLGWGVGSHQCWSCSWIL